MSTASPNKLMTAGELLALPDDPDVERMLIQGDVWESPVTRRHTKHSSTESMIAHLLLTWAFAQIEPRGTVALGEAGARLSRNPDSIAGIDVAYFSPEVAQREGDDTTLFDGPPELAVETLSTNVDIDAHEAKIREYLDVGVKLVWEVNPNFKTVTVGPARAQPEVVFRRRRNPLRPASARVHRPPLRCVSIVKAEAPNEDHQSTFRWQGVRPRRAGESFDWLRSRTGSTGAGPLRNSAEDRLAGIGARSGGVSPRSGLRADGAKQIDHSLYGTAKRP